MGEFSEEKSSGCANTRSWILYLNEGAEFDRQIFPYQVFSELLPLQKRMKPPCSVQSNFFRRVASCTRGISPSAGDNTADSATTTAPFRAHFC